MRVFAYTDSQDLVEVSLPNEWIAELAIDVWRLDLFDKDPLKMRVDCGSFQRQLNFRKLRDIAFSYTYGKRVYVGVHDGADGVCLSYPAGHEREITISDQPFSHHYRKYLEVGWETEEPGLSNAYIRRRVLHAWPAQAVTLRGNSVQWNGSVKRIPFEEEPQYVGESLAEITMPFKLPDAASWIFELFGAVEPVIGGSGVVEAMSGETPHELEVYVRPEMLPLAKQLLADNPVGAYYPNQKPSHDKAAYSAACQVNGLSQYVYVYAIEKGTLPEAVRSKCKPTSMYGLYCSNAHAVRGNRLQFLDLSKHRRCHCPCS